MASGEAALALIGAAFMAGLKAQATKEASALGKELAKETAAQLRDPKRRKKAQKRAVKKAVSPYHKHLGRVMKRLKKQHTKKNGDFKKGWDMRRIMASAHKEVKKKRK